MVRGAAKLKLGRVRKARVSAVRSRIMAAIKGKNTKPELIVRRALHAAGFRYGLHRRDLPGRPDIVLTSLRTAVFVHGCFWHLHDCRKFAWPKTNTAFWRAKLTGNVERDQRAWKALRTAGWHVEVMWECEITPRSLRSLERRLQKRRDAH